jgi:hypothetical protein
MAHAQRIPLEVLEAIANQIRERTPPSELGQGRYEIAESFPIWALGLGEITRQNRGIRALATHTSTWHHQIHVENLARMVARSTPNGPDAEDWQLVDLSKSSLPGKVDSAIDWIEKSVPGDPLVRMLVIASYYITAFWLLDGDIDNVVLIDFPEQYEKLQYQHLYSASDILQRLLNLRHAQGVPDLPSF